LLVKHLENKEIKLRDLQAWLGLNNVADEASMRIWSQVSIVAPFSETENMSTRCLSRTNPCSLCNTRSSAPRTQAGPQRGAHERSGIRPPTRRSSRVMTVLAASWITADFVIGRTSRGPYSRATLSEGPNFYRATL